MDSMKSVKWVRGILQSLLDFIEKGLEPQDNVSKQLISNNKNIDRRFCPV